MKNIFHIGDLLVITSGPYENKKAFVYNEYSIGDSLEGINVITENGDMIGSFVSYEQSEQLVLMEHTNLRYEFTTVEKLREDYKNGVFDIYFGYY